MLGLFVVRVASGALMLTGHGWPKLVHFPDKMESFPDPLGLGPAVSLGLAVFAEFFCSVLLVLGVGTRLVAVPLVVTMAVAAFLVHAGEPLSDRELPLLYGAAFLALVAGGGGKYQLGGILGGMLARYS